MEIKSSNDAVWMMIDRLDEINKLRPWAKQLVVMYFMNLHSDLRMAERFRDFPNIAEEIVHPYDRKSWFVHYVKSATNNLASIERLMLQINDEGPE